MERVILLKTQLAEAAKLGKSKDFRFKRISVILLDNFIEIQLGSLIKQKFKQDDFLYFETKKYKQQQRKIILNYYENLLKACHKENIINSKELFLLSFCHNVRNNLYHKIYEEELLVKVALKILTNIIIQKQPKWKTSKGFTSFNFKTFDPYSLKPNNTYKSGGNSESDWEYFLQNHFNFIDKREATVSSLLSKNIILKIKETRANYRFITKEFDIYFPYANNWDFNHFLLNYSFRIENEDKINEISEIENEEHQQDVFKKLKETYKEKWKYKKYERLKNIEKKAIEMKNTDTFKSLEIFISLRNEVNLIHEAINNAAIDLDCAIQNEINISRGK